MNKRRVLITAVGSMSGECVIKTLKEYDFYTVGCDIYPKEWHVESYLCDCFFRAPLATNEQDYCDFLYNMCNVYKLKYLLPLTDVEIDVINNHRDLFNKAGVILCMQDKEVLEIVRDKYKLYKRFEYDDEVPSIQTCLLSEITGTVKKPCIAKPCNGRSSEGLLTNVSKEQILGINDKERYIIQEQKSGSVYTVDYCRFRQTERDAIVPRRELLRTKNGAGLTVQLVRDERLSKIVRHIGKELDINGCVNMEFILSDGDYFLIDINPRFSAGVAFSVLGGYNMITNHVNCFSGIEIDYPISVKEKIMIKKYEEVIL